MALFKPKQPIHLGGESESSSRPWSIPCCVNLSLYKGVTPAIQLPQDSDNEQDESEDESPTIFPQHLSGNPFARAIVEQRIEVPTVVENFEREELSGDDAEEELADFSNKTFDEYSDTEESVQGFTVVQQDDTIPQIEDDVLKMLPLPQLSMEIPPTMIHAFEESKYSQLPLMSTNLKAEKRVSRFSMSEEEYLAYKKKQEEQKNQDSIPKATIPVTNELKEVKEDLQQLDEQVVTPEQAIPEQQETLDEPLQQEALEQAIPKQQETQQATEEHTTLGQPEVQQREVQPPPAQELKTKKDERRASMAQSILGDKLDDFTEKLAFIKKNIIMSMDSDEEEDDVENAEQMLKVIKDQKLIPNEQPKPPTLHRRASSLMDVAPSLARFMNQIGGEPTPTPSASSTFSPSSLFSAFAGPEPSTTVKEEDEEEEEELFDFTKVLEIGKNVKSFGEGVVGMFNDVATRVKNSVEHEQQQQQQKPKRNESMSSTSSTNNNENEWMHNYL